MWYHDFNSFHYLHLDQVIDIYFSEAIGDTEGEDTRTDEGANMKPIDGEDSAMDKAKRKKVNRNKARIEPVAGSE